MQDNSELGDIAGKPSAGRGIIDSLEYLKREVEKIATQNRELLETLDFVRGWFVDNNLDDENHAIFEEICAAIAKARRQ